MKTLFYSIIVSAVLVLAAEAVLVDGYCFLGGQTNHQGTKVKFQVYLAGVTDSTYTDTTGYYQINLAIGYYNVYFTHQGYWDEEIPGEEFQSPVLCPVY
jgi:hypothetical protein